MFKPSAKIVDLSALPSPSVSSRTLIRSRPLPGDFRGYSRLSVIQNRPRSSMVIATGLTTSGSPATNSTENPGGTVILAIASLGDSAGPGGLSWPRGMSSARARPDAINAATTNPSDASRRACANFGAIIVVSLSGMIQRRAGWSEYRTATTKTQGAGRGSWRSEDGFVLICCEPMPDARCPMPDARAKYREIRQVCARMLSGLGHPSRPRASGLGRSRIKGDRRSEFSKSDEFFKIRRRPTNQGCANRLESVEAAGRFRRGEVR